MDFYANPKIIIKNANGAYAMYEPVQVTMSADNYIKVYLESSIDYTQLIAYATSTKLGFSLTTTLLYLGNEEIHSKNLWLVDYYHTETRYVIKYVVIPSPSFAMEYKGVWFNPPYTTIVWNDGSKTIAKAKDGETFDKDTGVSICLAKRYLELNGATSPRNTIKKMVENGIDVNKRKDEKAARKKKRDNNLEQVNNGDGEKPHLNILNNFIKNSKD